MTTPTSAEEISKQQFSDTWSQTSGAATPWQFFSGSNAAFVAAPLTGTSPIAVTFALVSGIEALTEVTEPKLDEQVPEQQLPLFYGREDPLQHAMIQLIAYSPEPDEPAEEDIKPTLGYKFPG